MTRLGHSGVSWRERLALWVAPSLNARLSDWEPRKRGEYSMREWNALTQDQRSRVVEADPEPQPRPTKPA